MLLSRLISLMFLLLYFWYMVGSGAALVVPPGTPLNAMDSHDPYTFQQTSYGYQCSFLGRTWKTDMPDDYMFHFWEIRRKNPCFAVTDHVKVPATGRTLYKYLQKEQLQSSSTRMGSSVEMDASTAFQDRKVFYFECLNNEILNLRQCPPGHVFRHNDCLPVSSCLDQLDGTVFPDPLDVLYYYQCFHSKLERKQCSSDMFFEHDQCKKTNVQYFCQHNAFQMLDERTLLVCRRGRATFETCPPGFRYFDNPLDSKEMPVCESDKCVGVANGQKKSLPIKVKYGLVYVPGFVTCQNDRVRDSVTCPLEWDTFSVDHLLPLSQVFDETLQKCTVPQFCENVDPQDPETIIVPVYEWTKHLPLWKYSTFMDQVTGYKCVSGTRTRMLLPVGHKIDPQHMKAEWACRDNVTAVVPVSGKPKEYFDCATQKVISCHNDSFFNGIGCQRYTEQAFQYNKVDVFEMDSLDWDSWIKPWGYTFPNTQSEALKNNCQTPYIYNQIYNTCIHEDCALYPFLSQINFFIGLRDGSTCQFNESTRFLDKIDAIKNEKYLYWAQRETFDTLLGDNEPCQEGQHIQSGQFVFDATIFATCDPKQPFVFCPSPLTTGIENMNGVFACKPDPILGTTIMLPRKTKVFRIKELHQVSSTTSTRVKINNVWHTIEPGQPFDLTPFNDHKKRISVREIRIETSDAPVTLYYNSRVSHPPHVALMYRNGNLQKPLIDQDGYFYSLKHGIFTQKDVICEFPTYHPKPLLPEFLN